MSDSDPVKVSETHRPSDFDPIVGELASALNWKMLFLLFTFFIFLTSDIFMEKILSGMEHTTANQCVTCTTTYGTVIHCILLVLFYVIIDVLIKKNII